MVWLYFAIAAYFINAVNGIIDKFLLVRAIPDPLVYTFYVGLFSVFSLALAPFGLIWPGWLQFFASLGVGMLFLVSLYFLFRVLKEYEVSKVLPIVGGLMPIFVLMLDHFLIGDALSQNEIFAFIFLVLGSILISFEKKSIEQTRFRQYSLALFGASVIVSLLFALYYVSFKLVFISQPFITGFILTRVGCSLGALILFSIPLAREKIFHNYKGLKMKSGGLFVSNKALAGLASLLLAYAIAKGSVSLVNALRGAEYAFLFVLTLLISHKVPKLLKENFSKSIFAQKIISIVIIAFGLFILAFS